MKQVFFAFILLSIIACSEKNTSVGGQERLNHHNQSFEFKIIFYPSFHTYSIIEIKDNRIKIKNDCYVYEEKEIPEENLTELISFLKTQNLNTNEDLLHLDGVNIEVEYKVDSLQNSFEYQCPLNDPLCRIIIDIMYNHFAVPKTIRYIDILSTYYSFSSPENDSAFHSKEFPEWGCKDTVDTNFTFPEFPGGHDALWQYIQKELTYPDKAVKENIAGRIVIQFIVSKEGTILDVKVIRPIGGGCDEEAIRVIKSMPKWKPAIRNGKAVSESVLLPIQFTIEKEVKK